MPGYTTYSANRSGYASVSGSSSDASSGTKKKRTPARIGEFTFNDEFSHPLVDIDASKNTVTHDTIGSNSVTQIIGDKPDQINVQGVVTEEELDGIDYLTDTDEQPMSVRTNRWQGDAIVKTVSTSPRVEKWEDKWLYDVTISLVEETGLL